MEHKKEIQKQSIQILNYYKNSEYLIKILKTEYSNKLITEIEYNKKIKNIVNKRFEIYNTILQLENKYCNLIFKKYIYNEDYKKIARSMYYTYDYVRALHSKAVVEFYKLYFNK